MIVVLANYLGARQGRLTSLPSILGACILVGPPWLLVMMQPDLGTSLVLLRDPRRDAVHVGREPSLARRRWSAGRSPSLPFVWNVRPARLPEGPDPRLPQPDDRPPGRRLAAPPVADRGRVGRLVRQGPDERHPEPARASCRSRRATSWPRSTSRSSASSARCSLLVLFAALLWRILVVRLAVARPVRDDVRGGPRVDDPVPGRSSTSGMVVGIMPITGIPLPFISHGGASLISIAVGLGILQSINIRQTRAEW